MRIRQFAICSALIFLACTSFAQMYSVIDLGLGSSPAGINFNGQVVGNLNGRAFVWTNRDGFQELGTLPGGTFSRAAAINDLGTVTGTADGVGTVTLMTSEGSETINCPNLIQPFIWTPSNGMQGLGTVGGHWDWDVWDSDIPCIVPFYAVDINNLSEVVGYSGRFASYQFGVLWRDSSISLLSGGWPGSSANGINNSSQIVGEYSDFMSLPELRAASWKNSAVTFLPTLASAGVNPIDNIAGANDVNDLGQIVGWSCSTCNSDYLIHAVMWSQGGAIRDLGTLPGDSRSTASKINFFGQVIGSSGNTGGWTNIVGGRPFIWSTPGPIIDLNTLIGTDSLWTLNSASEINDFGQIVGEGMLNSEPHGFLLTPIYNAFVQQPLNSDGSSVFRANRGVIPLKFALTKFNTKTCAVLPATIAITTVSGGTLASVEESTYMTNADEGSNFKIDSCQYVYNLAAAALGVGTYRVDISINGVMVGHAVFALK